MHDRLCCNQSMVKNKSTPNVNVIASAIREQATDKIHIVKNPAAVALGRLGGLKGGKARAKIFTKARRMEIVKKSCISSVG